MQFNDNKTCHLLNRVSHTVSDFIFPEDPLAVTAVRDSFKSDNKCLPEFIYATKTIAEITACIDDFDIFDLVACQKLIHSHKISFFSIDDYVKLRGTYTSKSICEKHIDTPILKYTLCILELGLVQSYLFAVYPSEAFKARDEYIRLISKHYSDS